MTDRPGVAEGAVEYPGCDRVLVYASSDEGGASVMVRSCVVLGEE